MRTVLSLALLLSALPAWAAPKLKLPKLPEIELSKPAPANPDDPIPGGVFSLLPANGLIADGATAGELVLLALDSQGAPVAGLVGTPTSEQGTATALEPAGPGLYRFTFTPAPNPGGGPVDIVVKAKVGEKGPVMKGAFTVETLPPPRELLRGSAAPAQVVMGRDTSSSLALTLETSDLMAAETAAMDVRTSAGTVSAPTALGGGQFAARWTPPAGAAPGLALVTAVDRRAADRAYAAFAVPMLGKVDATVKVAPRARVLVKAQGRTFGPVDASAAGVAKVPLELAPGVTATLVEVGKDGAAVERVLELKIPEPRRIALFPLAASVPADARVTVPVRVFVTAPDGTPDGSAAVTVKASAGSVGVARHEGGGVYVAEWTPAESAAGGKVTLTARIEGASAAQQDTLPVVTTGVRVASVGVTAPATVAKGPNQSFTVTVTAGTPGGSSLPGRTPRVVATGARVAGAAKDLRDGRYEVPLVSTGSGPIEVTARVGNPASSNPVARLTLLTSATSLGADGLSTATLTVLALDRWGSPVAGVPLDFSVEGGVLDGNLPRQAKTDADGVATVYYTAGRARGYGALVARAGRLSAGTGMLQLGEELEVAPLPRAGTTDARELAERFAATSATVRIAR
jgi:hypothetical protein